MVLGNRNLILNLHWARRDRIVVVTLLHEQTKKLLSCLSSLSEFHGRGSPIEAADQLPRLIGHAPEGEAILMKTIVAK